MQLAGSWWLGYDGGTPVCHVCCVRAGAAQGPRGRQRLVGSWWTCGVVAHWCETHVEVLQQLGACGWAVLRIIGSGGWWALQAPTCDPVILGIDNSLGYGGVWCLYFHWGACCLLDLLHLLVSKTACGHRQPTLLWGDGPYSLFRHLV